MHLPWSPGITDDDLVLKTTGLFHYRDVVVTEKMDGENISLYPGGVWHARSLDNSYHESRDYLARWHNTEITANIPPGWRVCGEYLRATHRIYYPDLPAYFLVFAIYDETNMCLGWPDTLLYAHLLNLKTVPVLYTGPYDETRFISALPPKRAGREVEGYVIRLTAAFPYSEHAASVAKWVRPGHVTEGTPHWTRGPARLNRLATGIF